MQLPTTELTEVYNVNQFFCLFYATGRAFDQQLPRGRQNSYLPREELSESYHFTFLCLWRYRF